ncbi:hypothetical protein [Nocardia asteroides]|uniref:hypothetical protein n=1 Tax=Nocardia asteroides TaxID=1824 RepID=UPI001E618952|nr:hypothetical protein [Nocardia asteroides]UGT58850.1 hypothetical protein LTT85_33400 [Nocardia asteroides]
MIATHYIPAIRAIVAHEFPGSPTERPDRAEWARAAAITGIEITSYLNRARLRSQVKRHLIRNPEAAFHPTDLDGVGRVGHTVLLCRCGERHVTAKTTVPSTANPALATSTVTDAEFRAQRAWTSTHRPHGGIRQEYTR